MGTPFLPVPIAVFLSLISSEDDETEREIDGDCGLAMRYPEAFRIKNTSDNESQECQKRRLT